MESMEERLQKYRKEKAKVNSSMKPAKNLLFNYSSHQETEYNGNNMITDSVVQLSGQVDNTVVFFDEGSIKDEERNIYMKKSSQYNESNFDTTIGITVAILWLLGLYIFINIEFVMVYICISLLIFIFMNTRTNKDNNEISAYSVFNKKFEKIEGTLDASQIDSEIRGGLIGSV